VQGAELEEEEGRREGPGRPPSSPSFMADGRQDGEEDTFDLEFWGKFVMFKMY
jgi:hypothetical protein